MPNPRLVSLCLILIILFLFPDTPSAPLGIHFGFDDAIKQEKAALSLLNGTSYGDFEPEVNHWIDLPGLREKDGFAWGALDLVKGRVKELVGHILGDEAADALDGKKEAELPIYHNVTGHVRGRWVRSKLEGSVQRPSLNMTALQPFDAHHDQPFHRNITGTGGELRFDFSGRGRIQWDRGDQGVAHNIKADVVIADETSAGDGWTTVLYGVQFVDSGHILLATSSEK
jgi:hypothetical protein